MLRYFSARRKTSLLCAVASLQYLIEIGRTIESALSPSRQTYEH